MAADPKYKVEAELELKKSREAKRKAKEVAKEVEKLDRELKKIGGSALRSLGRLGSTMSRLGATMRRSSASSGSLVANLVAIGGTYIGVRAVSSAVSSLASTFLEVNSSVQNMNVALSALLSNVEGISFQQAEREADALFRQLNDIAVQSPATASELMSIFRGVYGPMRNAGTGMEDLLTFSRDAAAVAATLQVPYEDAAQHISKMVSGTASNEEATFRLLRSMGLITQTTEEWNKAALEDPAQAANRLLEIFEQLGGPAAEAFGTTWTGVSSTFRGLLEQFARVFSGPGFRVVITELGRINDFLLRYRSVIEDILTRAGTAIELRMSALANRINITFYQVVNNLEAIGERIDGIVGTFQRIAPIIRRMAVVGIAFKVGALALGAAFSIIGPIISVFTAALGALGPLIGALGGAGGIAGMLGLGGAGAAAAGTAAAGAGAATIGTGGIAAIVAIGSVLATLQFAFMALATIVPAVTAVLVGVWRNLEFFREYVRGIGPMLWAVVENIWQALVNLWEGVSPILEMFGFIIAGVVITAFRLLVTMLLGTSRVIVFLTGMFSVLMSVLAPLADRIRAAFQELFAWLRALGTAISHLIGMIPGLGGGVSVPTLTGARTGPVQGFANNLIQGFRDALSRGRQAGSESEGTGRAPRNRPTTNVDMRGSRIEVRQEFREADPDRVWIQMRDALEREAVQRTTSGFVPALTR